MLNFIRIQYRLGKVSENQLKAMVGKLITEEEYAYITEGR